MRDRGGGTLGAADEQAEFVAGIRMVGGHVEDAADVAPRLVETARLAMRHGLGQEALGGSRRPVLTGQSAAMFEHAAPLPTDGSVTVAFLKHR